MADINTRRIHYPNDKIYLDNCVLKTPKRGFIAIFYVFIFILNK